MANPRINIKNIDYFKFKKIIIDGNRDDYADCSKDVKDFCDIVQTVRFRDEEFDDESDRGRFGHICFYYKQILASKRIDPTDMRIKSGWWGDHKNAYSAGKIKPTALRETLIAKAKEYINRNGSDTLSIENLSEKLDGPGLYVFKHRDHQCFQYVGRADKVFTRCGEKLKQAFEGLVIEPLAALLAISMSQDWDFYFFPVGENDDDKVLRVLENDLILKHDCIWPHGLNFQLHIDSLLEVSQFRKSCARHKWPPDSGDLESASIDLVKLRGQIAASKEEEAQDLMSAELSASNVSLSTPRGTSATGKKGDKRPPTGAIRPTSGTKRDVKKPAAKRPPSADETKKTNEPEAQTAKRPPSAEETKKTNEPEAQTDNQHESEITDTSADSPPVETSNGVTEDPASDAETVTKSISSGSVSSTTESSRNHIDGDKKTPSSASPKRQVPKRKPITPRPTSARGRGEKSRLPMSPRKT